MTDHFTNALLIKSLKDDVEHVRDPYEVLLETINVRCHPVNSLNFEFFNLDLLKEKLYCPDFYEGIIFSSPRCVEAVDKCDIDKKFLPCWIDKKVFVVGKRTAENVQQRLLGLTPLGEDTGNALNLASHILKYNDLRSLLLPCGSLSRDTLHDKLSEGGLTLDKIVVYRTHPNPNLGPLLENIFKNNNIKLIICFSPSSVNYVVQTLKHTGIDLTDIAWVAIGDTTANAIKDNGLKLSCTASEPTPKSLTEAVGNFLSST